MADPGVRLEHPNRRKAASKLTRLIVVLLLLVSAFLVTLVTIGGWDVLQGAKALQIAYIVLYLVIAFLVLRWSRGVLPVAAALAIVLLIFAAVSAPAWFDRDKPGFTDPGIDEGHPRPAHRPARAGPDAADRVRDERLPPGVERRGRAAGRRAAARAARARPGARGGVIGANRVTAPDGTTWQVGRRWLPDKPTLWRRRKRERDDSLRAGEDGGWFPDIGIDEAFVFVLGIVAVVAVIVVLTTVVFPLLVLTLELLIVLVLLTGGLAGRFLLRKPWTIRARSEDGRELSLARVRLAAQRPRARRRRGGARARPYRRPAVRGARTRPVVALPWAARPGGGTGLRDGLKIHCPQGLAGSNPAPGMRSGGTMSAPNRLYERRRIVKCGGRGDHG